ncbi:MAG: molybdopterin-synthase adenylyltransferase MoeB [Salaquimonas sp.]|jgi:adenylyltransferase/sulfurtransferase|nr:molybdopterin-synthase adenylyltransferase MoeB [Salaquimonas sp.]
MTLSQEELERYARHIVLRHIGGPGQQKLKAARVLVVGAGGLGSPVIAYLAAAGIGTIGIVDNDTVSLSNLQRQIIHDTDQVGEAKTASATRAAARINPHVAVESHHVRLEEENARELVGGYDIVADGSDNFDTRYTVADACEAEEKTLVSAAVGQFDASLTTLKPHLKDENGNSFPRYRDLFPEKPPVGLVPTCAEAGILGALTGVIGSMQALEIIKEITDAGDSLAGRLVLYDALAARFEEFHYARSGKA